MSAWQHAYYAYRELVPLWLGAYAKDQESTNLDILNHFVDYGWHGNLARLERWFPRPKGKLEVKIKEFLALLNETDEPKLNLISLYDEEPFSDVYHAALHLFFYSPNAFTVTNAAYRGQRQMWRVQPSITVCRPPYKTVTSEELSCRIDRVSGFVTALAESAEFSSRIQTEEQRTAAAQHYGIPTWLLDVTEDPFIALFFASLGGQPGDLGILMQFRGEEWSELSAEGTNSAGSIKAVSAPAVRRLNAQKGFFLDGSHPDVVEQYINFRLLFRQQADFVFEDPTIGVTKTILLEDQQDPLAVFAEQFQLSYNITQSHLMPRQPMTSAPSQSILHPLMAKDYRDMVESWIRVTWRPWLGEQELPARVERSLDQICEFHARLQSRRENLDVSARSIRRFYNAAEAIVAIFDTRPTFGFEKAVEMNYVSHARALSQRAVLRELCAELADS